jgi:sugar/nucleoside kinase (ribokinase family)
MSHDIVVVGDVMTDIIVRPHGPLVPGSDRAATIRQSPGGSGANQAAWLGFLGAKVAFAGRVGAGDVATQSDLLRRHGVAPHLAGDADLPTGLLVTLLAPDGERSFLTDRGANTTLCRADLQHALLDGARLLHVSGYSLFSEGPRDAVRDYIAEAARRGLTVTADAGSAGFIAEVGASRFLDWTRGVEKLFANADEAATLAGGDDPITRLARLYRTVVVKRGAAGAVAASRGEYAEASADAIDATDTTGAGDAFLAGYLIAHLAGADLSGCLAAGVRHGTAAAARLGGRPPFLS